MTYLKLRDIAIDENAKRIYHKITHGKIVDPFWIYFKMMNQYHKGIIFSHMGIVKECGGTNNFTIQFVLKVISHLPNMPTIKRYFLFQKRISINPITTNTILKTHHVSNYLLLYFNNHPHIGIVVNFKKFNAQIIESNAPFLLTSFELHWTIGTKSRGVLIEITDLLQPHISIFKDETSKQFKITDVKFSKMSHVIKCVNSNRFILIVDEHFQQYAIVDLKRLKILQHDDSKFLPFNHQRHYREIKFHCHKGSDFNFYCTDSESYLGYGRVWKLDNENTRLIYDTDCNEDSNLLYCPVLKRFV
jgi:hypothetical protein